jgi:hypothetical protein
VILFRLGGDGTRSLLPRLDRPLQLGMIVRVSKGRFILNEPYYRFQHREETFRRLRQGETRKELLECKVAEHAVDGVATGDLLPILAELSRMQVRRLLEELQSEGRIHRRGAQRWARWRPGPQSEESEEKS